MNSLWISSAKNEEKNFDKIDKDYNVDVCIVGAGITGLSTAYYLTEKGLKVIVVDKAPNIGQKASGNTTAKITLQHGLIYDYLINSFGFDFALKYYEANKKAISDIKKIIDENKIDCDFEYENNYIYTTNSDDNTKIENEIKAINTLENSSNLQNNEYARFVTDSSLPFKISGAIEIKNQAQFNPEKCMIGLANAIINNGGQIFTNTLVSDVNKADKEYLTLCNEYKIKSKYVVLASHYPFINFPGFYFSKMYQVTSYAICIETKNSVCDGMYINQGEPTLSFRNVKLNDKTLIIIAGGNHKTGYSPDSDTNYGYAYVEEKAKELYPDCKILYKWDTRDCITLDKVPYIGDFSNFMPNVFIATGFNKWGMTTSNVAANIITDFITKNENKYADIYNATRFNPLKNRGELKNMGKQIFQSFVSSRIKIPDEDLNAIKNNNGGIIKVDGNNVGVYKDEDGNIYAVKPTCTHLGCLLTWNNVDKTWDCPCHGSRFDHTGKNLYDPAFEDLERYS